jgi:hypothetical protein
MAGGTWPSIFSVGDETVEMLDRLHATTRARREQHRASLDAVVAGLNGNVADTDEPVLPRREREDVGRRSATPDPLPFVALPQRTTHGGYYGPKVRDKLTREALGKRGW